jgi:hypothetical protein
LLGSNLEAELVLTVGHYLRADVLGAQVIQSDLSKPLVNIGLLFSTGSGVQLSQ